MRRFIVYFLSMVLALSVLLPIRPALASNVTLAEYLGTVRITNNDTSSAANTFTTFNLTTQDLIDGDFTWSNMTNTALLTNGGSDTAYMPAPGTGEIWCVYVPSIIAKSSLDYRLYLGGNQDMDGDIRYYPDAGGMATLDSAGLEPGSTLQTYAQNWTYEVDGYINPSTTAYTTIPILAKADAMQVVIPATGSVAADIWTAASATRLSYEGSDDATRGIHGATWAAQTFTVGSSPIRISAVQLRSQRVLNPGDITVSIRKTSGGVPTGSTADDLTSGTANANGWGVGAAWNSVSVTSYNLEPNTQYAIVARCLTGDGANLVQWYYDSTAPTFTGQLCTSVDSGATWTPQAAEDHNFRIDGLLGTRATATGVTADDQALKVDLGVFNLASGDTLHFDGTANSYVDGGVIYSNIPKLWVDFWFRLDTTQSPGSPFDLCMVSKWVAASDSMTIYILTDGRIRYNAWLGGVESFTLYSTTTTWTGGVWYHITASQTDTGGGAQRLIVNGVPEDTDTQAAANTPNAGSFVIGSRLAGGESGRFTGEIAFFTTGTDDLSLAEETALAAGYPPGDETDLWYMDEGAGTAIASYGSAANAGTAGVATSWETSIAPHNFVISIDGSPVGGGHVVDVPDNGNDWYFLQNNSVPYMAYQEITVDGVQQQYIEWENNETTFTDASGNGHDATPTFRTATSDADVTAELIAFVPVSPARADTWSIDDPTDMITAEGTPGGFYDETLNTTVPGVPIIVDIMPAGVPTNMFIVPLLLVGLCIVILLAGKFSLLAALIVGTLILFAANPLGIPPWIGIIFFLDGLAFVIASKQFGW